MTIRSEITARSRASRSRPQPSARGADALEIRSSGRGLGAFVTGLDANRALDAAKVLQLRQLLHEHRALIFPGQSLDQGALLDFVGYFGVAAPPEGGSALPDTCIAHIDKHWTAQPSAACLLHMSSTPLQSSEIRWVDLLRAYADLDAETKWALASYQQRVRAPFGPMRPDMPGTIGGTTGNGTACMPTAIHPLVRTHPELGRPLLFLSSQLDVTLQDIDANAGHALIERLRAHIAKPQYSYTHRWQRGDLVWWDNQAVLHACTGAQPAVPETCLRVDLAGARPF